MDVYRLLHANKMKSMNLSNKYSIKEQLHPNLLQCLFYGQQLQCTFKLHTRITNVMPFCQILLYEKIINATNAG